MIRHLTHHHIKKLKRQIDTLAYQKKQLGGKLASLLAQQQCVLHENYDLKRMNNKMFEEMGRIVSLA